MIFLLHCDVGERLKRRVFLWYSVWAKPEVLPFAVITRAAERRGAVDRSLNFFFSCFCRR